MPALSATSNKIARKRIAWLICLILALLLAGILGKEFFYLRNVSHTANTNQTSQTRQAPLPPGWPTSSDLGDLKALAAPVLWNAGSLADKINGKAELYLAAGFENMFSARFCLTDQSELFFEVQLFKQNNEDNAFAVFSQQRRSQGKALSWAEHGYSTSNALYIQQGVYYLEIAGVSADLRLIAAQTAWARKWLQAQSQGNVNPAKMFAPQNLKTETIMLLAKDAFGMAGFNNVWVAQYNLQGTDYLLFVKNADNAADAQALIGQLQDFWAMQGAVPLTMQEDMLGFELEGMYELFVVESNNILGIHEAANLDEGLRALEVLRAYLAGD